MPSFTLSKLNFPDSYSRLNRNTFTNIRRLRDKTKVKNISQLTTPIGALLCKFRQTCFRVLSTQGCRYNKKAGALKGSGFTRGTMGLFESYIIPLTMIKESSYIHIIVIFDTPVKHFIAFSMIVIGMPFTYQVEKS